MGFLQKMPEVSGTGMEELQSVQKFRVSRHRHAELTKIRAGGQHYVPVPRVRWHGSYRSHASFGYEYESFKNFQNFRVF